MYCRGDYHQLNPQRIQETPILCCCCLVERDSNVLITDENRPRLTERNENKLKASLEYLTKMLDCDKWSLTQNSLY